MAMERKRPIGPQDLVALSALVDGKWRGAESIRQAISWDASLSCFFAAMRRLEARSLITRREGCWTDDGCARHESEYRITAAGLDEGRAAATRYQPIVVAFLKRSSSATTKAARRPRLRPAARQIRPSQWSERGPITTPTDAQWRRLIATSSHRVGLLFDAIQKARGTLSFDELCWLDVKDVSADQTTLLVKNGRGETERSVNVPSDLRPAIKAALLAVWGGLVFRTSVERPFGINSLSRMGTRVSAAAGLPRRCGWVSASRDDGKKKAFLRAANDHYRLYCQAIDCHFLTDEEIRRLSWADVDLSAGTVRVNRGGKSETLNASPGFLKAISEAKSIWSNKPLFRTPRGRRWSACQLRENFQLALKRTGSSARLVPLGNGQRNRPATEGPSVLTPVGRDENIAKRSAAQPAPRLVAATSRVQLFSDLSATIDGAKTAKKVSKGTAKHLSNILSSSTHSLSKDELGDAGRMALKRLLVDEPMWRSVIHFPVVSGARYRID
jgi:hypothetical protein